MRELASRRADPPTLLDLDTLEDIDFPAIPEGYERSIGVGWAVPQRQASASRPLHYDGTENQMIRIVVTTVVKQSGDYEAIDDFVRFMESATVSDVRAARTGRRRSDPATLLLIWPGELSVAVKLESFEDRPDLFFTDGRIRRRTMTMVFRELVDGVLTKSDVRDRGSQRKRIFT